uniref:Uncharacterized protein n=1 Tax=Ursus maritimus TaxID=29073 RepID=A0A452U1W5_URSMA
MPGVFQEPRGPPQSSLNPGCLAPSLFQAVITDQAQQRGPQGPSVQGILQSFRPALRMLPVGGASTPKKHSAVPNLMEKGLMILQCVACRDNLVPAWKLRQRQQSLSKSAQAIGHFYRKKVGSSPSQDFSLTDTSFMAELQELRKVFLKRPGCPQFSTKATSMSHYGESDERGGPRDSCTGFDSWKVTQDPSCSQRGLDTKVDGEGRACRHWDEHAPGVLSLAGQL